MTNSISIAVRVFASRVLMSVSFDETLLPREQKINKSKGNPVQFLDWWPQNDS